MIRIGTVSAVSCIFNFVLGLSLIILYGNFLVVGFNQVCPDRNNNCRDPSIWYHMGALITAISFVIDVVMVVVSGLFMFGTFCGAGTVDNMECCDEQLDEDGEVTVNAIMRCYLSYSFLDILLKIIQGICLFYLVKIKFGLKAYGETNYNYMVCLISLVLLIKVVTDILLSFLYIINSCCSSCSSNTPDVENKDRGEKRRVKK